MVPESVSRLRLRISHALRFAKGLVVLLVLSAQAFCGEQGAKSPPLDVVFLLDSSASLFRTDPVEMREALVEAFSGYVLAGSGDRLAVAQFAGWEETNVFTGGLLLPPTEIPTEPEAREVLVNSLAEKMAAAKPMGSATDPNAAVEIALARVPQAEGRKVVAILITDGDVDVVEGESVREEYLQKAQEMFGHTGPDALARAAAEIFFTKNLPGLSARGVSVGIVGLGRSPARPGWFLEKAASMENVEVIYAEEEKPLESALRLAELSSLFGLPRSMSYGLSRIPCAAGEMVRVPLEFLPGTGSVRALVLAGSAEYDLSVASPDGTPLGLPQLRILGGGKAHRVVWLTGVEPGGYELRLSNRTGAPLAFEVVVFAEALFKLKIDWPPAPSMHLVGLPLVLKAALVNTKGEILRDRRLLDAARIAVDARIDGKTSSSQIVPKGDEDGAFSIEVPIQGFGPGRCEVAVTLEAFPAQPGGFIYTSAPLVHEFELRTGAMVQFARKEAWVGQKVAITGRLSAEIASPPSELAARIEPERLVVLTLREDGDYAGNISFDGPGTWKLVGGDSGGIQIVPGAVSELVVKERRMRLLSANPPHGELTSLDFAVSYREKTDGKPYELPVVLEVDWESGEKVELTASAFKPSRLVEALKVSPALALEAGVLKEHASGPGRFDARLRLGVQTDEELPAEPGEVELTALVEGARTVKALPVKLSFPNYWERMLILYMKYWVPAAAVLALLFLWLLWWITRARFKEHQIHPIKAGAAGFYKLRNLGGRRNAVGTPEVENSVRFKIRGNRLFGRGRVKVCALGDARISVNGEEHEGWVRLRHGDDLKVYGAAGDTSCLYWYFEREPTGDELEAKRQAYVITLGPDEFVIEGMDEPIEGGVS